MRLRRALAALLTLAAMLASTIGSPAGAELPTTTTPPWVTQIHDLAQAPEFARLASGGVDPGLLVAPASSAEVSPQLVVETARATLAASLGNSAQFGVADTNAYDFVASRWIEILSDPELEALIETAVSEARVSGASTMGFPPDVLGKAFKAVGAAIGVAAAGIGAAFAVVACGASVVCGVGAIVAGVGGMLTITLVAAGDQLSEASRDVEDARAFVFNIVGGGGDTLCNLVWISLGLPPQGCVPPPAPLPTP